MQQERVIMEIDPTTVFESYKSRSSCDTGTGTGSLGPISSRAIRPVTFTTPDRLSEEEENDEDEKAHTSLLKSIK